ncbi:hypothetical protein TNCV_1716031 [Trichonephila clavipes]|nr:hypothetical protein TNCV_1716031 [Trichonephila clavipes]
MRNSRQHYKLSLVVSGVLKTIQHGNSIVLSICTKEEKGAVMRFLLAEGVKPSEIVRERQWSCHVERSPTLQRIRGNMSDKLYKSVADYRSFSAGY